MQKNDDVKIYIPRNTSTAAKTSDEAEEPDDVRLYPSVSEQSL